MNVNRYSKIARICAGFWHTLDGVASDRKKSFKRRGVALLLVLTYIVVMASTVLAGFLNSQVSFSISANVRDDLKAYYKAKSALNLGRLMLTYQYELEQDEFFGERLRKSNFQLYQIIDLLLTPFKTGIVSVDVPNADRTIASYNLKEAGVDAMGDESGDFNVRVMPEAGRINLNKFANGVKQNDIYELCMMVANSEFDDLFNARSSLHSDRLSRMDQIAALIDWVDADSEKTYINSDCKLEEASGDESGLYIDQRKKYKVKNAKFTTLDELYEVAGFGDDLMEAFGETLTVYPVEKINVNLASAKVMYAALCNSVEIDRAGIDSRIWACADPTIGTQLLALSMALEGYQQFVSNPMNLLYLYTVENETSVIPGVVPNGTVVPFRNISEFYKVVKALTSDPELLPKFLLYSPTAYIMFGDKILTMTAAGLGLSNLTFNTSKLYANITTASPRVFRVVATGEYGDTKRTLTTVMDFNVTGGQYLYWREY